MKVHRITAQVRAPLPDDDPGQITYGFYTVEGRLLTMTDASGNPVRHPRTGETFKAQLEEGQNADSVACVLTREVWQALRGNNRLSNFNRAITYPNAGII